MEKLLLTVREAADVLSVSRSRVYGLICAEQLDSVKIGRSRRVSLASSSGISSGCVTWRAPETADTNTAAAAVLDSTSPRR